MIFVFIAGEIRNLTFCWQKNHIIFCFFVCSDPLAYETGSGGGGTAEAVETTDEARTESPAPLAPLPATKSAPFLRHDGSLDYDGE